MPLSPLTISFDISIYPSLITLIHCQPSGNELSGRVKIPSEVVVAVVVAIPSTTINASCIGPPDSSNTFPDKSASVPSSFQPEVSTKSIVI